MRMNSKNYLFRTSDCTDARNRRPASNLKRCALGKVPVWKSRASFHVHETVGKKKKTTGYHVEQTNFSLILFFFFLFLNRLEITKNQLLSKVFIFFISGFTQNTVTQG